ncbi:Na+-driven multidrug efflux pump [Paraoerskovia marina]|uniref:Na+-driven multidrug efflux pump n=1 Tax=Paraoerskovia marina TaxID=545619 RepID=A0A1H1MC34_9CELL|nr:MATE family efflux transporter [Paraoerskovia marina]SDR83529.1 Na+-driven multidrug efflux pump [Paraoerskovia marina]
MSDLSHPVSGVDVAQEEPAAPADGEQFRRSGLFRLSWPLLLVSLLTLLSGVADTVILSLASPELNAAVATANQILGIPYDLTVLFSIGALVVISQMLGAGRYGAARRATVVALRATTVLGIAIAAAVALLGPVVVSAINTPPELVDETLAYLWTVAGALAFNAFIVVATAVLRAYGRTVSILVLGLLVNVAYLALQVLFVLVLDMGAAGAALSTLLVRGVGVLVIAWLVRRRTGIHLASSVPRDSTTGGVLRMLRLSVPTVLENGLFNVAVLGIVALINTLGSDAINARSYVLTLTALVTGVVGALAQGNETIVGWDKGDRSIEHARRTTLRSVVTAALVAALLAAALWSVAGPVLSIFGANDVVVTEATGLLALSIVLLPLSATSIVLFSALRSTGDVVAPMAYSLGATFVVLLPVSWLLIDGLGLGLAGAWWALIAAEACKAGALGLRWMRGQWADRPREIRLAEA